MKTCPICQRKFSTKGGLKQHMDSVHSLSGAKRMARVNNNNNNNNRPAVRGATGGDIPTRFKREEFFKQIDGPANTTSITGYQIFDPHSMTSSRVLNGFAKLYENYRIYSIKVRFVSATRSTTNGQVVLGVDLGSSKIDSISKEGVMGMPHLVCPIHTNSKDLVIRLDNITRYTRSATDQRDKPFAIIWVVNTDNKSAAMVGDIMLEYDIEFFGINPE